MKLRLELLATIALAVSMLPGQLTAFHNGGLVQLANYQFNWIDPDSQGSISLVVEVFEGCEGIDPSGAPFFNPHDMTFVYVVANQSYDPVPGLTNGFSGFQIIFNQPIPEIYNQQSPLVGGPWQQNAFSGQFPPGGAEWDVPHPGAGVMPGEIGIFSFCTYERVDVIVNDPPVSSINGWAHSWVLEGTQVFTFNGTNAIPGEEWMFLDEACSDDAHTICKKVKYLDEDGDGIIQVGEPVVFLEVIQVHNPSPYPWTNVRVKDNWGGEIDVEINPLIDNPPAPTTATLTTRGKSEKESLFWDIGDLSPGETVNLVLDAYTDLNPGGHQEYTSPGDYDFNSGAVLKFYLQPEGAKKPHQMSYETGKVRLNVPE